jgi:hypothetical protein
MPEITRIELYKGIGHSPQYCALIFADGVYSARIDAESTSLKITHKSTTLSRLAGVDRMLNGVTLDRLLSHPRTIVNPSRVGISKMETATPQTAPTQQEPRP